MAERPPRGSGALVRAGNELIAYALSLPGAWEDHPWGETVVVAPKGRCAPLARVPRDVGKKVFVFTGWWQGTWGVSVKLHESHAEAMAMPFTEATGYGLGRAGWVSARFHPGETLLVELLKRWIRESYTQIAPKKRVAQLDAAPACPWRSS